MNKFMSSNDITVTLAKDGGDELFGKLQTPYALKMEKSKLKC